MHDGALVLIGRVVLARKRNVRFCLGFVSFLFSIEGRRGRAAGSLFFVADQLLASLRAYTFGNRLVFETLVEGGVGEERDKVCIFWLERGTSFFYF